MVDSKYSVVARATRIWNQPSRVVFVAQADTVLELPADLRPVDGRFGAGPSKVRPEQLARLAQRVDLMGTSHRQRPVKDLVAEIQHGISKLFSAPEG